VKILLSFKKILYFWQVVYNMPNYYQIAKEFDTETELAGLHNSPGENVWLNKKAGKISDDISANIKRVRSVVFLLQSKK